MSGVLYQCGVYYPGRDYPLIADVERIRAQGDSGKILTTDYLAFNDPAALDKLHSLKNIELKMFVTHGYKDGFHTKGYIFRKEEIYRIIIGSANMTAGALKVNREWNTKLVGLETGEVVGDILQEFRSLWEDTNSLAYEEFIEDYRVRYALVKKQKEVARETVPVSLDQYRLQPNAMQTAFVRNVRKLVRQGARRALLISATGTGKTYASAFALRDMHPKKVLFLVHREQIARQALASYQKVFGPRKDDGSPGVTPCFPAARPGELESICQADLVFATMQMMSRDSVREAFSPEQFTVICLDEAHHSGAESYRKIMDYFRPDFLAGHDGQPGN